MTRKSGLTVFPTFAGHAKPLPNVQSMHMSGDNLIVCTDQGPYRIGPDGSFKKIEIKGDREMFEKDIEARLKAATPGPWENRGHGIIVARVPSTFNDEAKGIRIITDITPIVNEAGRVETEEDTDFIAHAPTDMAHLLKEKARLREAILHVRSACRDGDYQSADNMLTAALAEDTADPAQHLQSPATHSEAET